MIEKSIPLSAKNEWQSILKRIRHSFAYTWENCHAMFLNNNLPTYLYHFKDGKKEIICPYSERIYEETVDIFTPYGFSGFAGTHDYKGFAGIWKEFAFKKNYICGYIGQNPILNRPTYYFPDDYHDFAYLHVIDLTNDENVLFNNITRNGKRKLKKWQEAGSKINLDQDRLKRIFLHLYPISMKRVGATHQYFFSDSSVNLLVNLENSLLIGSENQGNIESVTLFVYTPHIGESFLNGCTPQGRDHAIGITWEAILQLKSKDIPLLNLGGSQSKNDGLSYFKSMLGGKKINLGGFKQIYNSDVYVKICKRKGFDPRSAEMYFPPYRKR